MPSVRRLKNAKAGEPYGIEVVKNVTAEEASEQATAWWSSGGTLAVVVLTDSGAEDARYQREYVNADRVPDGWVTAVAKPVSTADLLDQLRAAKPAPKEAPSIFNEDEAPEPKKATVGMCIACMLPLLHEGHQGDDDPTPSGRLQNGRCPDCGSPQPLLSALDLLRMHLACRAR